MTIYRRFSLCKKGIPSALHTFGRIVGMDRMALDELQIEARTGETLKLCKIALLISVSKAFGLGRTAQGSPGTYGLDAARLYEDSDLATCELLLIGPQAKYQIEDERDSTGRLWLEDQFVTGLRLGSAWDFTVVSDEFRRLMSAAEPVGLSFREVAPRNRRGEPAKFWELESSIVLPKMANTDRLMYCGWRLTPPQPFTGDYSRMVIINDPPYRSGEIHYRRSELARLGKFDTAKTFELYRQPHPQVIISQRFYQHCRKNGIALKVEPVRIDPG